MSFNVMLGSIEIDSQIRRNREVAPSMTGSNFRKNLCDWSVGSGSGCGSGGASRMPSIRSA
ncbi:MAG: hypothetical protein QXN93_00525 [Methanomassiliicoccales archaeon]